MPDPTPAKKSPKELLAEANELQRRAADLLAQAEASVPPAVVIESGNLRFEPRPDGRIVIHYKYGDNYGSRFLNEAHQIALRDLFLALHPLDPHP